MNTEFAGFPEEGFKFLRNLKRNNRRDWFQPRKEIYLEQVRGPMVQLVDALNRSLARLAPTYIHPPEKAIYRVYRDTRFSHDKTPYKTHIAAIFPRRGMAKHVGGGLYISVSPWEVEVAGGAYMPGPEQLNLIRYYLAGHHEEFRKITGEPTFKRLLGSVIGDQLMRVPKGFEKDHPAADLVRYKQIYVDATLDPALALTPKLLPEIVARMKAMLPLLEFLNRPLVDAQRVPRASEFFL
ncbi:MAG: DUF2461 domain-containing protein [Acidobacteriales bacterium]|nr:DUF2461 domain-containing protein [Terriglobales bacterium]